MIKFLQVNLNHCRVAQEMLTQMEKEHHLDTTLISEPHKVPEDLTWAASDNGKACIHWNTEGYMSPCIKRKQGHLDILTVERHCRYLLLHLSKCAGQRIRGISG